MFIFSAAWIGASLLSAADHTPEHQLRDYLAAKTERGDVFAQGKIDGVDYRNLLRGALAKDAKSLKGIFSYTANGQLMGEGAESNCDILRQLLLFWGDTAYARVLATEPPNVRCAVISAIDYAWPYPGWPPQKFPITYGLSKHEVIHFEPAKPRLKGSSNLRSGIN